MLFAREGHACAVDSVATDNVEDLSIFLARRLESFLTGRHIVEEIFDLARGQSAGWTREELGTTTVI